MKLKSPAKINMHLEIGALRDDGYHDICSWFLQVGLFDLIDIEIETDFGKIEVFGNDEVPSGDDIILKAASLFYREAGISPNCAIKVKKEIPIGAGLGGGSSNAATVLLALNSLHGKRFDGAVLEQIALQLGSDVPFFLGPPSAIVTGRGEHIQGIENSATWWVLIVDPGFRISTMDAFYWFESEGGSKTGFQLDPSQVRRLAEGPSAEWSFFNSFTPVLAKRYPDLAGICSTLESHGAIHAGVSGSGSSCFGIFDTHSAASTASQACEGYRFWLKETLLKQNDNVPLLAK